MLISHCGQQILPNKTIPMSPTSQNTHPIHHPLKHTKINNSILNCEFDLCCYLFKNTNISAFNKAQTTEKHYYRLS